MLRPKAEEADTALREANTRKLKPTQRCPRSGRLVPKSLSQRTHQCPVGGTACGRDENAARTLLP
ncbi:MAG: zinc ribbon domain-containing protein [Betaproteobacteria bacterium]|nr:zinc ribbon domain-containing protein [Betaproteobacteria bacterium]